MSDSQDSVRNDTAQKIFPSELTKLFKDTVSQFNFNEEQNSRKNNFVAVGNNNGMINAPEIKIYINNNGASENFVIPAEISRTYYNLFVIGTEEYEKNYFFVEPDRAVSKYERTAPEIVEQFGRLNAESISQIKTFPSIFAAESRFINYQIDPTQTAYLGFVEDVKVQQNELIKIRFGKSKKIFQSVLYNLMPELEIFGRPRCSEFERTHWAIKKIDLIEVLEDVGIDMLNLYSSFKK